MKTPTDSNIGFLYICPTPIGNLEDITLRCLRTLKEVDYIACEDTRVTQKLLNHYSISTPLFSYHKFSDTNKIEYIINLILQGKNIALTTDAGTPLISDPGKDLIKSIISNHIRIIPLPGASALTCAASSSYIIDNSFIFMGFLPKKISEKNNLLKKYSQNNLPIIFFESPNRIIASLEDILNILGNINISIARELTKIHEEIISFTVREAIDYFKNKTIKGEFVIILDKIDHQKTLLNDDELEFIIKEKLSDHESVSTIAKELSKELSLNKSQIYKKVLEINNKKEN